jgi:hypothetical protein
MSTPFSQFIRSAHFGSYLAIISLALTIIGLAFPILDLVKGASSSELTWLVIVSLLLVCICLAFMYRLFKAQYEEVATIARLNAEISEKNKTLRLAGVEFKELKGRRERVAVIFRDLNIERSKYSGVLHRIQDLILGAPTDTRAQIFFPHSRRRFREMMEDVCDHLRHAFEAEKDIEVNVNIKFVGLIEKDGTRPDFLHTSGVSWDPTPPADVIAYKTVARCTRSRQTQRGEDRDEDRMTVANHFLLRNIVTSHLEALVVDDLQQLVASQRTKIQKKEVPSFIYPDETSTGYYKSAIIVPIVGEFDTEIIEPNERIPVVEDQLYGFLAVDSVEPNAFENKRMDIITCQEAAAIVMSILREYARCVSHWRAKYADLNKAGVK